MLQPVHAQSCALITVAVLCCGTSANALVIDPIFDTSITSLANAATVEASVNAVVGQFEASFSTPVTVKIGVSWGRINGSALPSGDISASQSTLTGPFRYSDIVGAFQDDAAENPNDSNAVLAAANLPKLSPAGSLYYEMPYAQAQALGFLPASISPDSGYIGFSSTTKWDFDPTNGVGTGYYDFQGAVAHEISEVLGRVTGLVGTRPTYATMFDVLRYSAPHASSFSYNAAAYFSLNGGVTNLSWFNTTGTGDRSDVRSVAGDAQDAFVSTSTVYGLSTADLTALDVLGWGSWESLPNNAMVGDAGLSPISAGMSVPEPTTWMTMLLGLGLAGAVTRRSARARRQPDPSRPATAVSWRAGGKQTKTPPGFRRRSGFRGTLCT